MTTKELKERLTDAIILLSIPSVGRRRFLKLVETLGSPADVLSASISRLEEVTDIGRSTASAIKSRSKPDRAREIAARIIQNGWAVLFWDSEEYPRRLREIPDRPPLLFRTGQPEKADERSIAIVGTRHATEAGRLFTKKLAGELADAGLTIVSGMAEGVDSYAHKGALDAKGKTVAVWGSSLDIVFPSCNRELAEKISASGAIYSEYFPESRPTVSTFPERNRIVSGLSDAVIVVEAGKRSGALITARCALEQGRELFAVPGPPEKEYCLGTNNLIKQGAFLLTTAEDVMEQLPLLKGQVTATRFRAVVDLTDMEKKMVTMLADGPLQIDNLAREASLPVSEVLGFLVALEMKGVVQELSGKRFVLNG